MPDYKANTPNGPDDTVAVLSTKLVSQVFDMNVYKIGHGERIKFLSPDVFGQCNTWDYLIFIVKQELENQKFLRS